MGFSFPTLGFRKNYTTGQASPSAHPLFAKADAVSSEQSVRSTKQPINLFVRIAGSEGASPIVTQRLLATVISHLQRYSVLAIVDDQGLADKLIAGNVTHTEGFYHIRLQLVDTQKTQTINQIRVRVSEDDDRKLVEAAEALSYQLAASLHLENTGLSATTPPREQDIVRSTERNAIRPYQLLKWGGVGLAAGGIGVGVGLSLKGNSKKQDYDRLFNKLVGEGTIIQKPNGGYEFQNDQVRDQYRPQLNGTKNASKNDIRNANTAFIMGGLFLASAGFFFYLDHANQKKSIEVVDGKTEMPTPNWQMAFSPLNKFAEFQFSF